MNVWADCRDWIERNDKAVRFLVWAALLLWAVAATIIANMPTRTYIVTSIKHFPPQTTDTMNARCRGKDTAQSWRVLSSNDAESAIYTSKLTPQIEDDTQVGYTVAVLNGAGSSNPRRPDVDVTMEVTCEVARSAIVRHIARLVENLQKAVAQ
jgi:hypothetical protein